MHLQSFLWLLAVFIVRSAFSLRRRIMVSISSVSGLMARLEDVYSALVAEKSRAQALFQRCGSTVEMRLFRLHFVKKNVPLRSSYLQRHLIFAA